MVRNQKWLAFQVGCTYIGTVVGAGFASGQEVYQFFGRFGAFGLVGIIVTLGLFAWLGYRVMLMGSRLNARSYHEMNEFLFGGRMAVWVDAAMLVMLFGVTVAMVAGAGELFSERFGISFQVGAILTLIITFLTMLRGMDGILRANSLIVPTMVSFVLYAFVDAMMKRGLHATWQTMLTAPQGAVPHSAVSALIYVAMNVGLAAGVLLPLGADIHDLRILRQGAWIGAIGLGVMLTAVLFCLFAYYPTALAYGVPMGYVASQIGRVLQWMFVFVLWGEIYSTLVGNVFAITSHIAPPNARMRIWWVIGLLLASFGVSQIGFATVVHYGYTAFGWMSTLIVFALVWPRQKLPEA